MGAVGGRYLNKCPPWHKGRKTFTSCSAGCCQIHAHCPARERHTRTMPLPDTGTRSGHQAAPHWPAAEAHHRDPESPCALPLGRGLMRQMGRGCGTEARDAGIRTNRHGTRQLTDLAFGDVGEVGETGEHEMEGGGGGWEFQSGRKMGVNGRKMGGEWG